MLCVVTRSLLVLLWSLLPLGAMASAPLPAGIISLGDGTASMELTGDVLTWVETGSRASVAVVAVSPERFAPTPILQRQPLDEYHTLWLKLRLVRTAGSKSQWTLNIPVVVLDEVTLYQREASGDWVTSIAGDRIAHDRWTENGLIPEFHLQLASGVPQDVYLRIRNYRPQQVPLRLATASERSLTRTAEASLLGLVLGAMLAMVALSLLRYAEHRDSSDRLAAVYAFFVTLTLAQLSGMANMLLWGSWPQWADAASRVLPPVTTGCILLFVRALYASSTHYQHYDRALFILAYVAIASPLAYTVLDASHANWIALSALVMASLAALAATVHTWLGGATIGRPMMLALVLQFMGVARLAMGYSGTRVLSWELDFITMVLIALSVPLLLYALGAVTHNRKELMFRANHLPTQDALTGLLTPEAFQEHLDSAVTRAIGEREPIALVVVNFKNHALICDSFGPRVGEQCLLRAVVKLHRVLRDVDPAGRTATARFALLLEGVHSREALSERMVKLVASGLTPLPGLLPEVPLQFQVACVLLQENPVPADIVLDKLDEILNGMSAGTRRPIRFLEPAQTMPVTYDEDLSGHAALT